MKARILTLITTVAMALALSAVSVSAQTALKVQTFKVPFEFKVGSKVLPAGDYKVYVEDQTVRLQKNDGNGNVIAITRRKIGTGRAETEVKLTFRRYGDQYYLSQVWAVDGIGRELSRPRRQNTDVAQSFSIVEVLARR